MTKYFTCFIILCTYSVALRAQTCTSGFGDPIVNITFGAGFSEGPALDPGITDLKYIVNECPNDGYYSIVNKTAGCFGNAWHTVNSDHTGDPNGYFMLINASYQPNVFYVQTVSGLCSETTYQFAAWVLNMDSVYGKTEPNITFSIEKPDGTILEAYNTGGVAVCKQVKWTQYGFDFSTPAGVSSVIIKMTNNSPGGGGNDLALDDITFRPAGANTQISLNGNSADTLTTCSSYADSIEFLSTVQDCYAKAGYQWQRSIDTGKTWSDISGAVQPSFSYLPVSAGTFVFRLTVGQSSEIGLSSCRVASNPITLSVGQTYSPTISVLSSNVTCSDTVQVFTASATGGGTLPIYQWEVNGIDKNAGGTTYTDTSLVNGDMVRCSMTSNAQCLTSPKMTLSNAIPVVRLTHAIPSVNVTASATTICSDSEVSFTATPINGGNNPSYQWLVNGGNVGTNDAVFSTGSLNNGDQISCLMTSGILCAPPVGSTNIVTMTVYPLPGILLPQDTVIAAGSSLSLNPYHSSFDSVSAFQWGPDAGLSNATSQDPIATPTENTTYQLYAVGSDGCSTVFKEIVTVYHNLNMPNGFTPNGDGKNDIFIIPPSEQVQIIRLSIYNQWGNLVFSTENGNSGWDGTLNGKPQSAGTYVWMIKYVDLLTNKSLSQSGTVMLLR